MSFDTNPTPSQVKLAQALANSSSALSTTTSWAAIVGLVKGTGTGLVAAVAGTDFAMAPMVGSTILDFGTGKDTLSATVTMTGVTASSIIVGSVCWDPSFTTRSEEELAIDPIHLSFRAGTNQVIVNASAALRMVVGKYKISLVAY